MRMLFDECTPRPLARELADVNAVHVHDLGWHGRRNGALLAAMLAEGFTALVTVDRNLAYQQNIPVSGVVCHRAECGAESAERSASAVAGGV